MLLLGIKHRRQTQADCLVACASMVLEYLGSSYEYNRLMRVLGTAEGGTPFTNLKCLTPALGLVVTCAKGREELSIFERPIGLGLPVIVALQTWPLPYWQQVDTDHAVVVVGLDDEVVFLYDPYFGVAPQIVEIDYFLTAWSERDFEYAVIGLDVSYAESASEVGDGDAL